MRWRQYKIARERMVREHVYNRGVRDPRVLEAMLRVPRHLFIGKDAGVEAYADHSYPIGFQQTMSQPYMVAYLTEELRLSGEETVLGDRHRLRLSHRGAWRHSRRTSPPSSVCPSWRSARSRPCAICCSRTSTCKIDDGWNGWPEKAPFDRVLLTAAAQQVPRALLSQLSDTGFLLGPVIRADGKQEIVRLIRRGGKVEIERLIECSFVPMVRDVRRKSRTKPAESGVSGS